MALTKTFGASPDDTQRNHIIDLLQQLGVITKEQRADLIVGTLIFKPGLYGFYDIGTGVNDD